MQGFRSQHLAMLQQILILRGLICRYLSRPSFCCPDDQQSEINSEGTTIQAYDKKEDLGQMGPSLSGFCS